MDLPLKTFFVWIKFKPEFARKSKQHYACKMNPPTSIDDLPPEMISELFEHLHPKDLAACSMVNKRWHSIYAAFKLHSLATTDYQSCGHLSKWYHSNQPIRRAELCRPAMFLRLAEKPLLSNLRQLALSGRHPEFDSNELNRFQQLVHLEINIMFSEKKVHLNLPKLKVLAFHLYNSRCAVSIDCPLLNTLAYRRATKNWLDVKHPETIKTLEVNSAGPELAPFKGVECLITEEFEAISRATLRSLPRLKELRYNKDIQHFFIMQSDKGRGTVDRLKRTLREFMDDAKALGQWSNFQLSFAGFQLTNVNVDQIDFGVQVNKYGEDEVCKDYVYMKNYHLTEPGALQFVDHAIYTQLLSQLTGEFPRCFSQKFTGIEFFHVYRVVKDPDQLLWLLKSLRSLRRLLLIDTGLSQEFYDQLPASASSLVSLELNGDRDKPQLNFDFIAQFSGSLSILDIGRPLSLESLTSVAKWIGSLAECAFYVQSKETRFRVEKRISSRIWEIRGESGAILRIENAEEVIHFFDPPPKDRQ